MTSRTLARLGAALLLLSWIPFHRLDAVAGTVRLGQEGQEKPQEKKPTTREDEDGWQIWWEHNFEAVTRLRERARDWHEARQDQRAFEPITDSLRDEVRQELEKLLEDSPTNVRRAAALALGKIGSPESRDALTPLLSDGNQEVRIQAMLGLGLLRDDAGFDTIAEVLRGKRTSQDMIAFGHVGLGLIGSEQALQVLESHTTQMLSEEPGSRVTPARHFAALAPTLLGIGLTGQKAAIPFLQKTLLGEVAQDADIRSVGAGALGKIDDPASVAVLARLLENKNIEVRRGAALALGEVIGPEDAEAERRLKILARTDADPQVRSFALISLGKSRSPSAHDFLESSLKERGQRAVRGFAAIALGLFGDASSAKLLQAVFEKENDSTLRSAIAIALGLLRDNASAAMLVERGAKAGDPVLRRYTLLALGLVGDPDVLPKLQPLLEPGLQPEVLESLLLTFGLLGDRASLDKALILFRRSSSETTKAAIAYAVGRLGDAAMVPPLLAIATSSDETDTTRAEALNALGNLLEDRVVSRVAEISAGMNYRSHTLYLDQIFALP